VRTSALQPACAVLCLCPCPLLPALPAHSFTCARLPLIFSLSPLPILCFFTLQSSTAAGSAPTSPPPHSTGEEWALTGIREVGGLGGAAWATSGSGKGPNQGACLLVTYSTNHLTIIPLSSAAAAFVATSARRGRAAREASARCCHLASAQVSGLFWWTGGCVSGRSAGVIERAIRCARGEAGEGVGYRGRCA